MAKLFLKRTLTGFVPADDASADVARRYKVGDVYTADVVKPRSFQHHRLCMALLRLTFENQDRFADFEHFRKAVTIAAGHSREFVSLDGEIWREAKSISFDALDEAEFTAVMASMMTVCAHLLHDMNADELASQVAIYADQKYGVSAT